MSGPNITAWVGAVLGVFNFFLAMSNRRPPIFIRQGENLGTDRHTTIVEIASGPTPVFVKRLWAWSLTGSSRRDAINVMALGSDHGMFLSKELWCLGKFSHYVPKENVGEIHISFPITSLPVLIVLYWSDFRLQAFPFTPFLLRRSSLQRLADAMAIRGNSA